MQWGPALQELQFCVCTTPLTLGHLGDQRRRDDGTDARGSLQHVVQIFEAWRRLNRVEHFTFELFDLPGKHADMM